MATQKEWIDRAEAAGLSVKRTSEHTGSIRCTYKVVYVEGLLCENDAHAIVEAIEHKQARDAKAARRKELNYTSPLRDIKGITREFAARFDAIYVELEAAICKFKEGDIICNGEHFGPVVKVEVKRNIDYVDVRYQFTGEDGKLYWATAYNAVAF